MHVLVKNIDFGFDFDLKNSKTVSNILFGDRVDFLVKIGSGLIFRL